MFKPAAARPPVICVAVLVAGLSGPALGQQANDPESDQERIQSLEARVEAQADLIRRLEERLQVLERERTVNQPLTDSAPSTQESEPEAVDDLAVDKMASQETDPPLAPENTDPALAATADSRFDLGDVKETNRVLSGAELESAEFPGSWPMFGSDLRMKIEGYLKADFVYDFDGTLDESQFLMRTIPVEGTPEFGGDPYAALFAKETRIGFDFRRIEAGAPPLRGFIEGDFFTEGNRFRLRHAYMNVGNFLAGQTWTTLSFLESLPFMIDFAAGDALYGGRETQLRYTKSEGERWTWSVAAENLSLLGIENPSGLPGSPNARLPLLAARGDYRWDSGVLFLGASLAELSWDGGAAGPHDEALQFNFVVAGRQALGHRNYVTWNVAYGEGSGENIIAFAGTNANAVLEADGTLTTIPALSVLLGLGRHWTEEWSSNLSYAYGWLDTPDSRDPLAIKRGGIGHVNLIWQPVERFSTGLEFMWGTQRVQNDAKGDASRLQLMSKFSF